MSPLHTIAVISGAPVPIPPFEYQPTATTGSGSLTITLKPNFVALAKSTASRSQWRSGLYVYRVQGESFSASRTVLLVK